MECRFPAFALHGRRYRCRVRWIAWGGVLAQRQVFEQGTVFRVWLGWILVTCLRDAIHQEG